MEKNSGAGDCGKKLPNQRRHMKRQPELPLIQLVQPRAIYNWLRNIINSLLKRYRLNANLLLLY
jgi:hypothetical protein